MGRADLRTIELTDTRDMRFGEILLVKGSFIQVYNTSGLNDCPAELWDKLDLDAIKAEYNANSVQKNGPHFWMMDSQTLQLGEKLDFGGVEARWAAQVSAAVLQKGGAAGGTPYSIYTSQRTQRMQYDKGKPVFELVDADANAYVLQAHDERFSIDSLASLGDRMNLPDGWQYRSRVLKKDLVLTLKSDQPVHMVGDEFHQYYTRY